VSALDIDAGLVETILVRFLRAEAGKFGFERAVLGVSGGIDSAVSAALCARAFGPANVLGVMMPYRTSNPSSEADARRVVKALGIESRLVEISGMADGYLAACDVGDATRRGNVMARCRMIVLYDLSVDFRGLVVGTSNKTEILLGYSTQWGDSASAVNPIGDLYKTQINQLARHLDVSREILEKAPSADLFEGHTDETELGFTYAEVDRLLYRMVDERQDEAELVEGGFAPEFVRKVAARIAGTQFKRVPPIVAKLSRRTVNQDFRYLRDWGR
jgi:NAD+ synthase